MRLTCVTSYPVHTVFEVAARLEKNGIGQRLQRTTWPENSFWTITAIRPSLVSPCRHLHDKTEEAETDILVGPASPKHQASFPTCAAQDGKHGDVSGIFTWKGRAQPPNISVAHKDS